MVEARLPLTVAGHRSISTAAVFVTTRVRMRHWWDLLLAYLRYRNLVSRRTEWPGLMRTAFVVEIPWVFHTLSLWRDAGAVVQFGSDAQHVKTAGWTFPRAAEIWAAEWHMRGLSQRTSWDGAAAEPTDAVFLRESPRYERAAP